MLPIAFAIVEAEGKDSWEWFLERLLNDLGHVVEHRWSFISDQQKVRLFYPHFLVWTLFGSLIG